MKLTENEKKVIEAYKKDDIVSDEGWDDPQSCTWITDFKDDCGIESKTFSGVISSLAQKGVIWTNGESFGLTQEGIEAAKTIN